MSSIYKLSITGIRSFSDESQETIQFGKPLTLIVGQNGSGKTTIIECLRYATAGELPPNTRNGASFINDPSLHASNETKAQIKLAFQNVNKVSMILSKNLMAIRNPKSHNISFKTRENQLMAIRNGERQTISSRVADIETLIPQQLGVSKAVLTYVIFCHQDDSLWPISDSSTLKKRFDEIFDSIKFMKVLEELKSTSKELNIDIKVLTNDVSHLKNDKLRAQQRKDACKMLIKQTESLSEEMKTLQQQISEDDTQLDKLYSSKQDYERTLSQLESLKEQKTNTNDRITQIKTTTKILKDSKENLKSKLDNFTNFMASKNQKADKLGEDVKQYKDQVSKLRDEYESSMFSQGKLESLAEKYEESKSLRLSKMSEYCEQFQLNATTDYDIFAQALAREISNNERSYNASKIKLNGEFENLQFDLTTVKEEITKEEQHASYIQSDIENLKASRRDLQNRIVELGDNSVRLESTKAELTEKEDSFEKAKKETNIVGLSEQIKNLLSEIRLDEIKSEELNHKMEAVRKNDEISSRKSVLLQMNKKASVSRDLAVKKVRDVLEIKDVRKDVVESYKEISESLKKESLKAQNDLTEWNLKKKQLEAGLNSSKKQRDLINKEMAKLESTLAGVSSKYNSIYNKTLTVDTFESSLREVSEDYNDDYAALKNHESYVTFNNRALELAKEKNACLLCHREFHRDEKSKFFTILKKENEKLSDTSKAEAVLKEKRALLKSLRLVSKDVSRLKYLTKTEIVKADDQIRDATSALDQASATITEKKELVDSTAEKYNQVKVLAKDVEGIQHWDEELEDHNLEIKRITQQIGQEGMDESYEELERQIKANSSEMKEKRSELEKVRSDKDIKVNSLRSLESLIGDLRLKVKNLELKSVDKRNMEQSVKEKTTQITGLTESLKDGKEKLIKLQECYKEKQKKVDGFKSKMDETLNKSEDELNVLKKAESDMKDITKSIDQFEKEESAKLQKIKEATSNLKQKIAELEPQIAEKESTKAQLEIEIGDASGQQATISYNLELISLEDKLRQVESDISKLDVAKAEAERGEYVKRSQKLQAEEMEHRRQYATKVGEKTQIEKQTADIRKEIERDYNGIDNKYQKQCARLQTKLALVTDLGTCYKATDDGVMKFHHQKMVEINRIIDELWKSTYTGNDVESIMIKADPGTARKTKSSQLKARRSYNYRVVMIKNGIELDMRGRCSAGQKVLASIIIRLALAECFGLNFGMIALDEPTTNLDEENAESLARALCKIIEMRSVQRNFQLIVITHDEKFLRYMNAVEFTDHYYKIMRDERLHSTINKVNIASLE